MRTALIAAVMWCAACATNPPPVPVTGSPSDVSALVGEWTGEYRSTESGRSGSILFKLAAGSDTAHGDIVMVNRDPGMSQDDAVRVALDRQAANQVLTIRFVRVAGANVTGTIDAYQSPDCNCQVTTVFRGQLSGNQIAGTYRTSASGQGTPSQEGTWRVTRTR
jgi:hypothetical protein